MISFPHVLTLLTERSVVENFTRALRRVARAYWAGAIDRQLFAHTFGNELEYYLTKAFNMGAQDVGIAPNELLPNETFERAIKVVAQLNAMPRIADFIQTHSKANGYTIQTIYTRLELWIQQFTAIRNFARMYVGKDRKLRWDLGKAEHCPSCLKLAGHVHRASAWLAAWVYPQSPRLACGGYRCQCKFTATSEPCTPGKVPTIP